LLADGVDSTALYPLDVDRAFKSLNKIKKDIKVWWSTGQQPAQLLATKEVDFSSAWSGRIWTAKHKDNSPLKYNYNQALIEPEWWVILKGSKNKDNALKFIAFASQAKRQAEMAKAFGVAPTNKDAFQYLDKVLIDELPTSPENIKKQIAINGDWWAKNEEKVKLIWEKWLLD
jgi:putative spermidine/putrescine transport system substrate-binding protein